MEINTRT